MYNTGQLIKSSISCGSTIFDLGSDLLNSLNFLGYGLSSATSKNESVEMNFSHLSILTHRDQNSTTFSETEELHTIWGIVGLAIMFLPGSIVILERMIALVFDGDWKTCLLEMFVFMLYPILLPLAQIGVLLYSLCGGNVDNEMLEYMAGFLGLEAFFECSCQMVLQLFTIIYGNTPTSIQIFTIASSFIMLTKTAIEIDILARGKGLGFVDSLIHMVKVLPCYASTIVFRVCAFALTLAFLRLWALVPMFFLFLEMAMISYNRYRDIDSAERKLQDTMYLFLSNVGCLTLTVWGN